MKKIIFILLCFVTISHSSCMEEKKNGSKETDEKDKISRFMSHYLEQQGKEIRVLIDGTKHGEALEFKKKDIQKFLKKYPLEKLLELDSPLTLLTLRALYTIMSQTKVQKGDDSIEIKPPCAELHQIISAAYHLGFADAQEKIQKKLINE